MIGLLANIFGDSGKSSIHAGFGIFYSAFEGLSAGIMSANAPYGYDYDSTGGHPLFNEPFVSATRASSTDNRSLRPFPPSGLGNASEQHRRLVASTTPITGDPAFYYRNTSPYSRKLQPLVEREVSGNTFLRLGYTGSQAHHLLALTSANPGNPARALASASLTR